MAQVIAQAEIVRCEKCRRGLAEDYGFVVLVRHRGRRARFYGPGRVVISCLVCGSECVVVVRG